MGSQQEPACLVKLQLVSGIVNIGHQTKTMAFKKKNENFKKKRIV